VKILVDMNLSPRWVTLLDGAGIEATHWSTVGPGNAPDVVIMAYAADNDWVVLTTDLDFSSILAVTGGGKPSVVQIRARDVSPGVVGGQVIMALRATENDLKVGALITIDTSRTRMSMLPLRSGG
jgi:predicted nuclease of predicted toxin-antitoxin system